MSIADSIMKVYFRLEFGGKDEDRGDKGEAVLAAG